MRVAVPAGLPYSLILLTFLESWAKFPPTDFHSVLDTWPNRSATDAACAGGQLRACHRRGRGQFHHHREWVETKRAPTLLGGARECRCCVYVRSDRPREASPSWPSEIQPSTAATYRLVRTLMSCVESGCQCGRCGTERLSTWNHQSTTWRSATRATPFATPSTS